MTATRTEYHVGITDYITAPADIEQAAFPEAGFCFLKDWQESEENHQQWRDVEAILVWHLPLNGPAIDQLTNCKIVVRYGVGYDLIDAAALKAKGLVLCNTPDYGTEEVADTACAMILSIQRKVISYHHACRHYTIGWQEHILKPQQRTSEQALGLIGVGRIGTAVINRMKPFGYQILGYDPYQPSGHEKAVGYRRVHSLGELLSQSDIVTVHCPLTEETRHMINSDSLQMMKPGASLVNTARGQIIDDLDCIENALKSGRLGQVGLDCLPDEPPRPHPLLTAWRNDEVWLAGRLFINPHAAYYSESAWYEMRYKAAETARMYLIENRLRNAVSIG